VFALFGELFSDSLQRVEVEKNKLFQPKNSTLSLHESDLIPLAETCWTLLRPALEQTFLSFLSCHLYILRVN
jgi:hypothetical protein